MLLPLRKDIYALLALLFLFMQGIVSQSLRQPASAIYLGLGAYSTQHSDVFSFVNNQAALAQTKKTAAGVYNERRFLVAATTMYSAAIAVPSPLGNFGVDLTYAGFKNFNEYQAGLAYARSLGAAVDIGMQFNYYGYRVPGYSNASAVNFELGAIIHLTKQLNAGIHVYNPVGGKFSTTGEQLSAAYTLGLGYDASKQFFVSAEIVKQEDEPVNVNAGIEYRFMKQFFARGGISSATSAVYGGVGVSWKNLRLDVSGSYHLQLGWSPGVLLLYDFGGEDDKAAVGPE